MLPLLGLVLLLQYRSMFKFLVTASIIIRYMRSADRSVNQVAMIENKIGQFWAFP